MRQKRAAAGLLVLFLAAPLLAHDASMNGLAVSLADGRVTVTLSSHLYKIKPALGLSGELTAEDYRSIVREQVHLLLDGAAFIASEKEPAVALDTETGVLSITVETELSAGTVEVTAPPFPQMSGSKCTVTVLRDGVAGEGLLDADHPSYTLRTSSWTETAGRYFLLGLEHIYAGLDHLLFVAALILLGGGLKRQVKVVTAFTLAHSVTLSLAAAGVFTLPSFLVEPAIALSITAAALENLRQGVRSEKKGRDLRPWLALGFGLVHGFGFAGALAESGLPPTFLPAALGFFNLGVEAGQLSLVLVLLPLLKAGSARLPGMMPRALTSASVVIGALGLLWFVQRVMV